MPSRSRRGGIVYGTPEGWNGMTQRNDLYRVNYYSSYESDYFNQSLDKVNYYFTKRSLEVIMLSTLVVEDTVVFSCSTHLLRGYVDAVLNYENKKFREE